MKKLINLILFFGLVLGGTAHAAAYTMLKNCEQVPASNAHTAKWEEMYKIIPSSFPEIVAAVNATSWCSMTKITKDAHWLIFSHASDGAVLNLPILIHPKYKDKEMYNRMEWGKIKQFCFAPGDLLLMGEIVERVWVSGKNKDMTCKVMALPKRRMHSEGMGANP